MIAADMDAAAEIAVAVDADAPAATAVEVAIADAAARDVVAANCRHPNTLHIDRTSQPNSKALQNPSSRFCCPASRCPY